MARPFYTHVKVWGNKVLLREINPSHENSKKYTEVLNWHPRLFIPSKKESVWRSVDNKVVSEMEFGSIKEAKDFVSRYDGVGNFEMFGNTEWKYQFIADRYKGEIEFDSQRITKAIIDLEVNSSNGFPEPKDANEPITAITMKLGGTVWTWSYKAYSKPNVANERYYIKCDSEYKLLKSFLDRWKNDYPDILSGWNVKGFDVPYLVNRMNKVLGPELTKDLSPWRIVQERTSRIRFAGRDVEQQTYEIAGVEVVDYLDAYKKFVLKPRESYRLGYIAQVELGDDKIAYDEDAGLHGLYETDFDKFIDYNIHDVILVDRLDQKLKLFDLVLFLAYNAKVNFADVFSQVRMWDSLIYNELLSENVIVPQKSESVKTGKYEGAYVKTPQSGFHRWVSSFDFEALYPSLFIAFNVSPETHVPYHNLPAPVRAWFDSHKFTDNNVDRLLTGEIDTTILREYHLSMTPNGQFFRTDVEGFMPRIVKRLKAKRKTAKKKMLEIEQKLVHVTDKEEKAKLKAEHAALDIKQQGIKVTMNSMYGAAGNEYFRFFDLRIAMAITVSGQMALRWTDKHVNIFMNRFLKTKDVDYVLYGDTDSLYIALDTCVQKAGAANAPVEQVITFMDKICKDKFEPVIKDAVANMRAYLNAPEDALFMKREVLCDTAIWQGKKRYLLSIWNSEGVAYDKAEIKVKGVEIVKSSTPKICRDALKKSVAAMLKGDVKHVRELVKEFEPVFMNAAPDEIAFPRGANDLEKYRDAAAIYSKGTPMHIRAALLYNDQLKKRKLDKKLRSIESGDKIKFLYLKEPNPLQENCIAFRSTLPSELELHQYIDKRTQFDKTFIEPLTSLLDASGWKLEEVNTLEALWN